MQALKSWIDFHCPTLQTYLAKGETVAWILIHSSEQKMKGLDSIDVRILINIDKSYELQEPKGTIEQCEAGRLAAIQTLLPLLHSFESGLSQV